MKKVLFIPFLLLVFFSCSPDEETQAPTNTVQTTTPEPVTQYTLTVTASEGGSVSVGGTFDDGTFVSVSATANEGYEFIGWSDGETSQIKNLIVSENTSITSQFLPLEFDVN